MILVDTSVWVTHLRVGHEGLTRALEASHVAAHTWVTGELALGGASAQVLALLDGLPSAPVASATELRAFIDSAALAQTGIGWVDAQLLASARLLPDGRLLTEDRKLEAQARRLGVAT